MNTQQLKRKINQTLKRKPPKPTLATITEHQPDQPPKHRYNTTHTTQTTIPIQTLAALNEPTQTTIQKLITLENNKNYNNTQITLAEDTLTITTHQTHLKHLEHNHPRPHEHINQTIINNTDRTIKHTLGLQTTTITTTITASEITKQTLQQQQDIETRLNFHKKGNNT